MGITISDEVRVRRRLPTPAMARELRVDAGLSQWRLARELDVHFLRLVFERAISTPHDRDGLIREVEEFGEAWDERRDVSSPATEPLPHPGDPRDLPPVNAWLLKGKRTSYPTSRTCAVTPKPELPCLWSAVDSSQADRGR